MSDNANDLDDDRDDDLRDELNDDRDEDDSDDDLDDDRDGDDSDDDQDDDLRDELNDDRDEDDSDDDLDDDRDGDDSDDDQDDDLRDELNDDRDEDDSDDDLDDDRDGDDSDDDQDDDLRDELNDDRDEDDSDDDLDDDRDGDFNAYREDRHDRYSVELDEDGNVVGFTETKRNGRTENELDNDSTYIFENGRLVETEFEDDGSLEVTVYEDLDGDGLFTKVSEQYVTSQSSTPRYSITSEMRLLGSDEDDVISLSDDTPVLGGAGQDTFVFREVGDAVITDFRYEDQDKIVFDTGLGITSVDQLAGFVTHAEYDEQSQTLFVDFSGVATLTVVGVQAEQISWDLVSVLS